MIISKVSQCPRCATKQVKHIPAGFSRRTQKPYAEFWLCDNPKIPCEEDGRVLSWKSGKQWDYLSDQTKRTSAPS